MSMQGGQMREGMESMRSASQISTYLKDMDFPTDKRKIVDMAKSHGAPENVMQMLNKLPDKQYANASDVEKEFGKTM